MLSKIFSTKRSRMLLLMLCDIFACIIASFVALWVRFDFSISSIPYRYAYNAAVYQPLYVIDVLLVFSIFHLYSYMWSKASIREMIMTVAGCIVATMIQLSGMVILELHQPRSYYIICFFVLTTLAGLFRYSWRLVKSFNVAVINKNEKQTRIIIYGAGEIIGQIALRPQKYWISSNWCTPFVLFKNNFYSNSIEEKHGLSIPCINPIISKIILVSTKMLLKYLRFARALGNLIQLKFQGLSVLM